MPVVASLVSDSDEIFFIQPISGGCADGRAGGGWNG